MCSGDNANPVMCDAPIIPPEVEVCDNIDNDCDGETDEDVTRPCSTACGDGTEYCTAGIWHSCDAPPVYPEICDNIDNDCDGDIDEAPNGAPLTQDCFTICDDGFETCSAGNWYNCTAIVPVPEVCNNYDDDCDGYLDEDEFGAPLVDSCYDGPAGTLNVGICSPGTHTCQPGGVFDACQNQVMPQVETCDGEDDDCDGDTDEDELGAPLLQACYGGPPDTLGVGVCVGGLQTCVSGSFAPTCDGQVIPHAETCNGLDDDCDGITDENQGQICMSEPGCSAGLCLCLQNPLGDYICILD